MSNKKREIHRMGEVSPELDAYVAEQERLRREEGLPFIGISRYRIGIDGKGVTTLVAFHGCPLHCKYCLNPEALGSNDSLARYTPESLLEKLKIDDLYFRATGGGICFGGGEPLLNVDFITRFKKLCPPEWKITIETSLHADYADLKKIAPIIDEWIVDVKTDNPETYEKYTGQRSWRVEQNLKPLTEELGIPREKFTIRVPVIHGFVSEEEARQTAEKYREAGFQNVQVFTYVTERPDKEALRKAVNHNGKEKCEFFKSLRRELANRNGIDIQERVCSHEGDCPGTCPLCDFEIQELAKEIEKRNVSDIEISDDVSENLAHLGKQISSDSGEDEGDIMPAEGGKILQGDVMPPEDLPLEGMPSMPPDDILPPGIPAPPELIRQKVLFKECAVAGVSFHLKYDDEIWDELEAGQEVALVRDRKNKYDKNAVAIALADDYDGDPDDFDFDFILGYVPKTENAVIAKMLDMGWEDAFYTTLSTVKHHGNINDRLRISIFIQSKEPEHVKPDLLRIQSLGYTECKDSIEELQSKGFIHFRWGGFPVWERNLPDVGEEVVLLRRQSDKVLMFLTRVLSKGDDCTAFLDIDEVHAVDDCICFVLTNVVGPLTVDLKSLDFLGKDSLGKRDVGDYLTQSESDQLKDLFKSHLYEWMPKNNIDEDPSLDETKKGIPAIIEWITKPTLHFYYRDTSAPVTGEYQVGDMLRTDFTVDLSEKFFKPARKTRFLVASAHVDSHCEMYQAVRPEPKNLDWRLVTIPRNSYFMVADIYEPEDVDNRQILLLHVPVEAWEFANNTHFDIAVSKIKSPYPYVGNLIEAARQDFDSKLTSTIFPRQKDKELVERMKRPIGFIKKGKPVPLQLPIDEKQLLRDFIAEKLQGNIEALAEYDFSTLNSDTKYGCLAGPNIVCNYAIVKAILAVAFGDKWRDLYIESLDDYTYQIHPIVRTQRLFGSLIADKYFMGLDKYKNVVTPDLMREAFDVEHWSRTIGNLLVVPSKTNLYEDFDNWQMRGYFDRMLKAVYATIGKENLPKYIAYINDSMLNDFVDEGYSPKDVFVGVSIAAKDFWPTQLPLAIHEMYTFCKHFIPTRTEKIITILKEQL